MGTSGKQRGERGTISSGALTLVSIAALATGVQADEVRLRSGAVIEGQASRRGDAIVVRLESGEISLPADTVESIREATSRAEIAERRRAALAPRDVAGRIDLAAYCRQHELRATERALLHEVLDVEPDHAQARRLLGYVKANHGWVERSAQHRAVDDAEWSARQARQRAEARDQEQARAMRERELASQQSELAREDALRAREEAANAREQVWSTSYYAAPHAGWHARGTAWNDGAARPWRAQPPCGRHGCSPSTRSGTPPARPAPEAAPPEPRPSRGMRLVSPSIRGPSDSAR